MPPHGARRPDEADLRRADRIARRTHLDPPRRASRIRAVRSLHRLNRAEYANAIRDLLALEIDAASLLPPDDSAYGFDNISDVLGVSPSLQERYLSAARKISALAVGDPRHRAGQREPTACGRTCRRTSTSKDCRSAPSAARSCATCFRSTASTCFRSSCSEPTSASCAAWSIRTRSNSPSTASACISRRSAGTPTWPRCSRSRRKTGDAIEARLRVRVPVKAGPHARRRGVRRGPARSATPGGCSRFCAVRSTRSIGPDCPHIQTFTITGPFNPTGPGDTPSRRRIFVVPAREPRPANCRARSGFLVAGASRVPPAADRCRSRAAARLLRSRPPRRSVRDRHSGGAAAHPRQSRSSCSGSSATRRTSRPGAVYRVSDVELASRLSFFLWSSIPDDELLDVATRGRLEDPAVLEQQVRRMLADPTVAALVSNFAGQWLQLRNVRSVLPNSDGLPGLRRQPARVVPARDRDALRERHARGPQRARSADGPTTRS